ncbi:MAG: lysostaphin resistance A-like protein [Bariatricus sp.]
MGKQIRRILRDVNPLNNQSEMPAAVYVLKKLLAFFLLYWISAVLGEGLILGGFYAAGYDPLRGDMPTGSTAGLLPYYGFAVFFLITILYCRFVEGKRLPEIGFNSKIGDYILGAMIAAIMLSVIIGVCCMSGSVKCVGIKDEIDGKIICALFLGFMIQGAAEEAMCRGFLMHSLLRKISVPVSVMLSGTAFAAPHFSSLFEEDFLFGVIGIINLYLISAIFSFLTLLRSNVWISCGLHSMWNFILYGVSGMALSGAYSDAGGVISFEMDSANLFNGGNYGIEASIVTTVVCAAIAAGLFVYGRKRWEYGVS